MVKALPRDDEPKWAPPDNAFKILLLGEGGVGRTTLAYKYVYGGFVPDTVITKGIQVHFKDIMLGGKFYSLHLWDLAGQDRFWFMHPTYAKGAKGAIFFYDLTRLGTLDNIAEWVRIARTYDKDLPVMMCGVKPDLVDERTVSEDYARSFLQPLGLFDLIEASSKTGQNIELVFETMARKIIELAPPKPARARKGTKKKAVRPATKRGSRKRNRS